MTSMWEQIFDSPHFYQSTKKDVNRLYYRDCFINYIYHSVRYLLL